MSFLMSLLFVVGFVVWAFCSFVSTMLMGAWEDEEKLGIVGVVVWIVLACVALACSVMLDDPSWPIHAPAIGIIVGTNYGIGEMMRERRMANQAKKQAG